MKKLLIILVLLLMTGYACAETVTLPADLTVIGDEAFMGTTSLGKVIVPEGVTSIGSLAFADCGLWEIRLPESVTYIAEDAFEGSYPNMVVLPGSYALEYAIEYGHSMEVRLDKAPLPLSQLTYVIEGETCTITGYTGSDRNIVLPTTIESKPVTALGSDLFSGNTTLLGIALPETLTHIGSGAFRQCTNLCMIEIPDGVREIGSEAFMGCTDLWEISMPLELEKIGSSAFEGCTWLHIDYVGGRVKEIGDSAFQGCKGMDSRIVLPEGLVSIGARAFQNCEGLSSIYMPDSVQVIGSEAFSGTSITSFRHPLSWQEVKQSAESAGDGSSNSERSPFTGCFTLKEVVIPSGVTNIPDFAYACIDSQLKSLSLPKTVSHIGKKAFYGCFCLESLTLPSSLVSIADNAFSNIYSIGSVCLPESLQVIGNQAFSSSSLTAVEIPDALASADWGEGVFSSCYNLQQISLPEGMTRIPDDFLSYTAIETIQLPAGLKEIGSRAFASSDLTSISIPDTVTSIGSSFIAYTPMTTLALPALDLDEASYMLMASNVTSVTLVDGFKRIPENMFYGAGFPSISIPDSVEYIGGYAFQQSKIQSIRIPDSVTEIGRAAFNSCPDLKSVTLPNGMRTLPESILSNSPSLISVTLPDSLEVISAHAFGESSSLSYIKLPDTLESIGEWAFCGTSLTSITLPSSLKLIGTGAFVRTKITSLVLPAGMDWANMRNALMAMNDLKSIYIPERMGFVSSTILGYDTDLPNLVLYGPDTEYLSWLAYHAGCRYMAGDPISSSTLAGKVVTSDGAEAPDVWVTIKDNDTGSATSILTGSDGRWSYLAQPAHSYTITFNTSTGEDMAFYPASLSATASSALVTLKTVSMGSPDDLPALSLPRFIHPTHQSTLNDATVNFRWEDQYAAESWTLRIYDSGNGAFIHETTTTDTSCTVTLSPGASYYAELTVSDGTDSQIVTYSFSIAATDSLPQVTGFTMASSSILVGTDAAFTVSAPDANLVMLVVDGSELEVYSVVDGTATFSRAFTQEGSRQVSFRAGCDGAWGPACAAQTLTVTAQGTLDAPVVSCPDELRLGNKLNVSWQAVTGADGYSVYLTAPDGSVIQRQYDAQVTSVSFTEVNMAQTGSYEVLVMAFGTGYSQSSTRVYVTVTDAYETWTGWIQATTATTYADASCSVSNGYVDYIDPVTVLGETSSSYLIEMTLTAGGTAQRYVLRHAVGTEPFTPGLTMKFSWSCIDDVLEVTVQTGRDCLGVGMVYPNGNEYVLTDPTEESGYQKRYVFSKWAPDEAGYITLWAIDNDGERITETFSFVPPEPTATPEVTVTVTPTPTPTPTDTGTPTPTVTVTVTPTPTPPPCDHSNLGMIDDASLTLWEDGSYSYSGTCEYCGTYLYFTGESSRFAFKYHSFLNYYGDDHDTSYLSFHSTARITVYRDLKVTRDVNLCDASLTVYGKLTVEGSLYNCGNIRCESLEIADGGELRCSPDLDATVTVDGACTVKGLLQGPKKLTCSKLTVSGMGDLNMATGHRIDVNGDFKYSADTVSRSFYNKEGQINVDGNVDINGNCFQYQGKFVMDGWDQSLRMENLDVNYFAHLVTEKSNIFAYDKKKGKLVYDNWDKNNTFVAHKWDYDLLDADGYNLLMKTNAIFDSNGDVIKPMLTASGEVDESAYRSSIRSVYLGTSGSYVPLTYDLTTSCSKYSSTSPIVLEAREAIGMVLTELDLNLLDDRDTSWECSKLVYLRLNTHGSSRTVYVNGHKWVVHYNGLDMRISPKEKSSKEVEWYNGWATCDALNVTVDYNATTTQQKLSEAATALGQVANDELEDIVEDLMDDILDDAKDLLKIGFEINKDELSAKSLVFQNVYGNIKKSYETKQEFKEVEEGFDKLKEAYELIEELHEFGLNAPYKPY